MIRLNSVLGTSTLEPNCYSVNSRLLSSVYQQTISSSKHTTAASWRLSVNVSFKRVWVSHHILDLVGNEQLKRAHGCFNIVTVLVSCHTRVGVTHFTRNLPPLLSICPISTPAPFISIAILISTSGLISTETRNQSKAQGMLGKADRFSLYQWHVTHHVWLHWTELPVSYGNLSQ